MKLPPQKTKITVYSTFTFHLPRRSFLKPTKELASISERNFILLLYMYKTTQNWKQSRNPETPYVELAGEHLKYKTARNHLPRMDGPARNWNDTRAWQIYTHMHILLSLSTLSWLDFCASLLAALMNHSSHSIPATISSAMNLARKPNQANVLAGCLKPRHSLGSSRIPPGLRDEYTKDFCVGG